MYHVFIGWGTYVMFRSTSCHLPSDTNSTKSETLSWLYVTFSYVFPDVHFLNFRNLNCGSTHMAAHIQFSVFLHSPPSSVCATLRASAQFIFHSPIQYLLPLSSHKMTCTYNQQRSQFSRPQLFHHYTSQQHCLLITGHPSLTCLSQKTWVSETATPKTLEPTNSRQDKPE